MSEIPAYGCLTIAEVAQMACILNGDTLRLERLARAAEREERRDRLIRDVDAIKKQPGFVYFLECGGFIKIGYTRRSAEERIADMSTANPLPISLLATMKASPRDEKFLHARFAELRVQGEWFKKERALLLFIEQLGNGA